MTQKWNVDWKRLVFTVLLAAGFLSPALAQLQRVPAIRTVAGNGTGGYVASQDGGAATSAELNLSSGVAVDSAGNLYIADTSNNRIRKVAASTGIITTVAGNGTGGYVASQDGGAATSAELNHPEYVVVDSGGNLYIADTGNNRIRRVAAATGIITTVAGNGTQGYGASQDGGAATSAELYYPTGVVVDSAGNLYIADSSNNRIRKVAASTGIITTVAGNGTQGYVASQDGGAATSAELYYPCAVAVDSAGNLYIADFGNHRIRKVAGSTGIITTVAGNGTGGYVASQDGGAATSAELYHPNSVAVDSAGNLYIGDTDNNRIRKVAAATGIITTVAGDGNEGYLASQDGGAATSAQLYKPAGVAVDGAGNLYIADHDNNRIRKVDSPSGSVFLPNTNLGSTSISVNVLLQPSATLTISSITAAASLGGVQEYTVGNITGCTIGSAQSETTANLCVVPVTFSPGYPGQRNVALTAVTSLGTVSFGLSGTGQGPLAALTPGVIATAAGNGTRGYVAGQDGGAATAAELYYPYSVAVDSAGNFYIADSYNHRIRKVAGSTGIITTVAGNGTGGYAASQDGGAATAAELYYPYGMAVDSAGNLYIADAGNNRIRKVAAATGIITTVAGNGPGGYVAGQDGGAATAAELYYPYSVAVDSAGNLYIADTYNHRIREVAASTGIITTVAGNGTGGYAASQDGGAATSAELYNPNMVAVDSAGNLYIADAENNRIRKVAAATGIITTVAGNGPAGYAASQDGSAATSAEMYFPSGVAVDSAGNLYIADTGNNRIRKVAGSTGIITTVAGNGTGGYVASQDGGAATSAMLHSPSGVAVDSAGNLYIADYDNNRIRQVSTLAAPLSFPNTPVNGASTGQTVTLSNIGNADLTFPIPSTGQNHSLSPYFTQTNSSSAAACPVVYANSFSPATLSAGSSCSVALSYTPTLAGAVTGNLIFTDNNLNATSLAQTLVLTGNTGQALTVVTVGQNVPYRTASIMLGFTVGWGGNTAPTGSPALTVNGSSTGVDAISCVSKVGHSNCSAAYNPYALAPGTYSIAVTQPADSNYAVTSGTATLTVTGSIPKVQLAPSGLSFSPTVAGGIAQKSLTFSNQGATAVTIGSIVLSDTTNFSYSSACGTVVAANSTCNITVSFTPSGASSYSATLTVNTDGDPNAVSATLAGTGTARTVRLSPSSITFPNTAVGSRSNAYNLYLYNDGDTALTIENVGNASPFSQVNDCGTSLAAHGRCTLSITFAPQSAGTTTVNLAVLTNGNPNSVFATLSGTGTSSPFGQGGIRTANRAANQVTLRLQSGVTSTGRFTLLTGSGAACGTASQVNVGLSSIGAPAFRFGSLPLEAGNASDYTLKSLQPATAYTACFSTDGVSEPVAVPITTTVTTQSAP